MAVVLLPALATLCLVGCSSGRSATGPPNIVILFADDMGYGDLSSYGHPRIKTPNIDGLADEGIRFTSFVTGAWCVPSRTQLMTGRYLPRVKAEGRGRGLVRNERTLAEILKEAGYDTAMAGKWHLGIPDDQLLPVDKGFDSWLGTPRSNDARRPWAEIDTPLAMFRGREIIEFPLDQTTLTTRYTKEAVDFIDSRKGDTPFFFYLAYNMPHLPIHTTKQFHGKSDAGLYGDVVQAIDWSVGQVLAALKRNRLEDDTIVFFASDNGPWLDLPPRMLLERNKPWHAGSAGPLRGSKATTYEGGTRVPAMIRYPGHIEPGQDSHELVGMPDIFRTLALAGGGTLPNRVLDGHDLMPFLTGAQEHSPRTNYFYFRGRLEAMRDGDWKLRVADGNPELYDMVTDPFERFNRAQEKPEIVRGIYRQMKAFAAEVETDLPRLPSPDDSPE